MRRIRCIHSSRLHSNAIPQKDLEQVLSAMAPSPPWLAPETLIEMEQDVQSSISYAGGTKLMDVRKVNYVILGGDNAGEHLLM